MERYEENEIQLSASFFGSAVFIYPKLFQEQHRLKLVIYTYKCRCHSKRNIGGPTTGPHPVY